MQEKYSKWIDYLYGPYFKVAGFFYRIYTANRARAERIRSGRLFAGFLRFLAVAILFVWIGVWLFASDEDRGRLTEEVKQTIGGFDAGESK